MKRKYLDIEQHSAISVQLFAAEDELNSISHVVGRAYGAAMAAKTLRTWRAIERVRMGLETQFYTEHPGGVGPIPYVVQSVSPPHQLSAHCATIRRMATTIIDPEIPYVEPTASRGRVQLMFREHLVVGKMLSAMRLFLMELFCEHLQHAYGKTHEVCKRIRRAIKAVEGLKCALDTRVCSEYPLTVREIEGIPITHVYYSWATRT